MEGQFTLEKLRGAKLIIGQSTWSDETKFTLENELAFFKEQGLAQTHILLNDHGNRFYLAGLAFIRGNKKKINAWAQSLAAEKLRDDWLRAKDEGCALARRELLREYEVHRHDYRDYIVAKTDVAGETEKYIGKHALDVDFLKFSERVNARYKADTKYREILETAAKGFLQRTNAKNGVTQITPDQEQKLIQNNVESFLEELPVFIAICVHYQIEWFFYEHDSAKNIISYTHDHVLEGDERQYMKWCPARPPKKNKKVLGKDDKELPPPSAARRLFQDEPAERHRETRPGSNPVGGSDRLRAKSDPVASTNRSAFMRPPEPEKVYAASWPPTNSAHTSPTKKIPKPGSIAGVSPRPAEPNGRNGEAKPGKKDTAADKLVEGFFKCKERLGRDTLLNLKDALETFSADGSEESASTSEDDVLPQTEAGAKVTVADTLRKSPPQSPVKATNGQNGLHKPENEESPTEQVVPGLNQ